MSEPSHVLSGEIWNFIPVPSILCYYTTLNSSIFKLFLQWQLTVTDTDLKMAVIWVVMPHSLVEVYQNFRAACCLYHQSNDYINNPADSHF
jgi:hypothetical protein